MELILTPNSPKNTEISTPDGHVLYSVSTPNKLTGETTKIVKHAPSDGASESAEAGEPQELAGINWHHLGTTRIIYNGEILEIAFENLRGYKEQTAQKSIAYLEGSVRLSYVLLRLLEKWGKGSGELVIRKKKKSRKSKGEESCSRSHLHTTHSRALMTRR